MRPSRLLLTLLIAAAAVVGIGVVAAQAPDKGKGGATVSVKVPPLSMRSAVGKTAYDAVCAQCHGANGAGTTQGPPFVNDIYNPGHHADEAFIRAVRQGVRRHHWLYGDMPAQPLVTDVQLKAIVIYVRELQQANGIFYKPHQM